MKTCESGDLPIYCHVVSCELTRTACLVVVSFFIDHSQQESYIVGYYPHIIILSKISVSSMSIIAVLSSSLAQADTKVTQLKPVVVKASKISKELLPQQKTTTINSTVIRQKELKKEQISTAPKALEGLPGLTVVQSGGEGQQTSVFTRGTNSNHTQVYRDGMKLTGMDPVNGAYDFGRLGLSDLENIDILKGPVTSAYGADAPGGIILLKTPKGKKEICTEMSLEGGSYRRGLADAELAGATDKNNLYLNIHRISTQSYNPIPHRYRKPGGQYKDLPFQQTTGTIRLGHDFSPLTSVSLINQVDVNSLYMQNNHLLKRTLSEQEHSFHRLLLDHSIPQGEGAIDLAVGTGYTRTSTDFDKHTPSFSQTKTSRFQTDGSVAWAVNRYHQLKLFGDFSQDSLDTSGRNSFNPTLDDHSRQWGIGALYQLRGDSLLAESSVRLDHLVHSKDFITYRFGGTYEIFSQTWLSGAYGKAMQMPTLYERFAQTPFFIGNPDLEAEEIHSYEIGLKRYWTDQFKTDLVYFYNSLSDIIEFDFSARPKSTPHNMGKAKAQGVEVVAQYQYPLRENECITLAGNYTYTDARNTTHHKRLLRRPYNKWKAEISYEKDGFITSADVLFTGQRMDINPVTFKRQKAKKYQLFNLKVSKKTQGIGSVFQGSQIRYYGRIENVFNRKAQDPLGYRKAGFGVFAGLEIKFA